MADEDPSSFELAPRNAAANCDTQSSPNVKLNSVKKSVKTNWRYFRRWCYREKVSIVIFAVLASVLMTAIFEDFGLAELDQEDCSLSNGSDQTNDFFNQGISTEAPPKDRCFIRSTCQGHVLDHEKAQNKSECLSRCKLNAECKWATFDFVYHFCTHFSTCPSIDYRRCESCITSSRNCPMELFPDKPCNSSGRCQGRLIDVSITRSKCHERCYETQNCHWYSFDMRLCMLFETCDNIDNTLASFTTKHYTCPEALIKTQPWDYLAKEYKWKFHSSNWKPFAYRTIPNAGADCNLFCEEDKLCDFFLTYGTCYLGTFRKQVQGLTEPSGMLYIYAIYKNESLPILEDYFIAKDYYLPTSLILERLLYESHNVSCIEQCQMMCLFEDFDCQFYITTKDDNVDQGLKCFFGGFRHKSYMKLSPPNITNDNLLLNVRRDKYVNTTNGILAAHNIDNFFGWCPGDGIHLVNKLGWKLNFRLKYEKYSSCTFYIVKPIGGTLKMTIPHFQSVEDFDYFKIYSGVSRYRHRDNVLIEFSGNQSSISYEWNITSVTLVWYVRRWDRGNTTLFDPMDGSIQLIP